MKYLFILVSYVVRGSISFQRFKLANSRAYGLLYRWYGCHSPHPFVGIWFTWYAPLLFTLVPDCGTPLSISSLLMLYVLVHLPSHFVVSCASRRFMRLTSTQTDPTQLGGAVDSTLAAGTLSRPSRRRIVRCSHTDSLTHPKPLVEAQRIAACHHCERICWKSSRNQGRRRLQLLYTCRRRLHSL